MISSIKQTIFNNDILRLFIQKPYTIHIALANAFIPLSSNVPLYVRELKHIDTKINVLPNNPKDSLQNISDIIPQAFPVRTF